MTKTITLTNAVIISITNYFASDDYWQNHNDSVSASISWIIRKNKKEISKALELIKEAETELNEEYNTDEKSQYAKDEDGNDTTDKVVKPEYAEEYLNKKVELYNQSQDVKIEFIKPDDLMKYNLKDVDWDMMEFMIAEEDEESTEDDAEAEE